MIEIRRNVVYLPIPVDIFTLSVDQVLNRFVERQINELVNNLNEIGDNNPNVGTTVTIQGQLDGDNRANFLSSIRVDFAPSGDDSIDTQIQSQIDTFYSMPS